MLQSGKFDPRHYQLVVQMILLAWGIIALGFPITISQIAGVLITAIITQTVGCYVYQLPIIWLSTLNTSLSILLLLHAQNVFWLALVAFISIANKFFLRLGKQHIFNPSNMGIVVGLLLTDSVWAAPGQWGHGLWGFLLIAGLGLSFWLNWRMLCTTFSFIVIYSGLLLLRAAWLGDPWDIPLHQLQNGSLLLFSFFMLSDPKTTPSHPLAKLLFGTVVAMLVIWLQFKWYIPNAFLYALFLLSPSILLLNRWFTYPLFQWAHPYIKQQDGIL